MKNKILKIILIVGVLFFIVVGGVLTFIIYSLPSAHHISEAMTAPQKKMSQLNSQQNDVNTSADQTFSDQRPSAVESSTDSSIPTAKKETYGRQGLDNLIDPDIPLSDFCQSLKNSKSGSLNTAEFNSQFKKSVDDSAADPRIQAAKPLFRTIFREPKMRELILDAQTAVENKDENFWQKAAFYSKAVLAFQALISNKAELEAVSDRSYLFFKMNELISKKPELISDQRIQNFCTQTEDAFNTNQEVQFDQEKKNFERVLSEVGVGFAEINYNPNYKTAFDFSMQGQSMQLNGGWLEELFSKIENKPQTPQ